MESVYYGDDEQSTKYMSAGVGDEEGDARRRSSCSVTGPSFTRSLCKQSTDLPKPIKSNLIKVQIILSGLEHAVERIKSKPSQQFDSVCFGCLLERIQITRSLIAGVRNESKYKKKIDELQLTLMTAYPPTENSRRKKTYVPTNKDLSLSKIHVY